MSCINNNISNTVISDQNTPTLNNNNSNDYQSLLEQIEKLEKRNQHLEKEVEFYKGELTFTRNKLSQSEELLLHLQWDDEDGKGLYLYQEEQKKKKSKTRVETEERQKIHRLASQVKLMENAIEERDDSIRTLSKELIDSKISYQNHLEALSNSGGIPPPKETKRSFTSFGFKQSPSMSTPKFKTTASQSPMTSEPRFYQSSGTTPNSSPQIGTPNFQTSASSSSFSSPMSASSSTSFSSPMSSTPSMMEMDYNKKKGVQKSKTTFFGTFKKSKKVSPPLNPNWANQSQTPAH
ncbi:hypothetical protein DLAC_01791 [Tieghemostelium lacteum]|uniref:Uncharacterized protein n=1 Tax=Tieghemostelium lacteum TaxID=361077 RepID=A0A152A6B2_TIELA|nr:hypothetical protein DLAC_01791 [Tieghemostelium lacteum]|eukprot:KYR01779.1 hypothetical protein DLAC_01791 [Tieghemostelium lacteum]